MAALIHFTYLFVFIYTLLVIFKVSGSRAMKISINENITGFIGKNDIPLTCSFIKEANEHLLSITIIAKNKTENVFDDRRPIVIFTPNTPVNLHSSGNYLKDRVTLTNITSMSTNATLTFNVLRCEDGKDYMCSCFYIDQDNNKLSEWSESTRISVQVISSKPDSISSFMVLSPKPEKTGYSSSLYTTSLSTKQYDLLTFRTSSIDTTTKTHLPLAFHEGDTVMFTCTGNVGNPPGKLVWQKMFPHENKPITYANESTHIEKIPGKCSFIGTSYLTVKIDTDDIDAKLRCFEESQVNVPWMYIETKPFNVYFPVNHLDITKQPNQKQYDTKTFNITLTCKGNGNPQPTYTWFKEGEYNTILSNQSFYVIENVIEDNSGVYICEVYNIIEDIRYRKSNSVEINIGSFAANVSISPNITGLIGNNDISLTCSFTNDAVEQIVRVQFFAKNKSDEFDFTKPIAKFEPGKPARLLSSGNYLNSRVTLTNLTSTSTNATLTFLVLKCDDEKDYMCQCFYDNGVIFKELMSTPTRISVQATSSKPDSISSIIVLSTKTEIQGYSSPIYNYISTKRNAISSFRTLPVERVTTKHMQSTDNFSLSFREGDTVMFTCMGNIGNPPGKLIWQKTFLQGKKPVTYSNETTYIEEITGQCSFKGTSHLTVKVYAEDIKATIRCFEESQVNVTGMFLETEPFDIQFHVDELPSSKDSSLLKIVIVYVIPVVCVVLFIGICVAAIKCCCIRPKKKDELETGYLTCMEVTGSTIVNCPNNYEDLIASGRTIVYDEINQQTTLNNEVSKAQMSVSTDNCDHYDAIYMDVAMQSSVNDG